MAQIGHLWKLLTNLGPGAPLAIYLKDATIGQPESEPTMPLLQTFCDCCANMMM